MKISKIANAVGYIDDDIVVAAAVCKNKKNNLIKWVSLAACLIVLVTAATAILSSPYDGNVSVSTNDRYKDCDFNVYNDAIVWSWEYLTTYEKYTELTIEGVKYGTTGREVSAAYIEYSLGTYTVEGNDYYFDQGSKHTEKFDVYKLKDVAQSQYVAVRIEQKYYVFHRSGYTPPSNLGELSQLVDLRKVIEFSRFYKIRQVSDDKCYMLSDDEYIWDILAECKNASFIEDQNWRQSNREYLSFSVTSPSLGVYKRGLYVTTDGYLWTNIFGYQYLFYIGEEAANNIIYYANENSTETESVPYDYYVVGTVTEINDEYILLDDSALFDNPDYGITYKIMLDDIRASRYADCGIIAEGDTVQVVFENELLDNYIINSVSSINRVKLSKQTDNCNESDISYDIIVSTCEE